MVYSTCTLNKEENEKILQWALENLNIKLLDINIGIKEAIPAFNDNNIDNEDFNNFRQINDTKKMDNLNKAIRILPSKNMEGFFVAKLQKI